MCVSEQGLDSNISICCTTAKKGWSVQRAEPITHIIKKINCEQECAVRQYVKLLICLSSIKIILCYILTVIVTPVQNTYSFLSETNPIVKYEPTHIIYISDTIIQAWLNKATRLFHFYTYVNT